MSYDLRIHFFGERFPFEDWSRTALLASHAWHRPPTRAGNGFEPRPASVAEAALLEAAWRATDEEAPRREAARWLAERGDARGGNILAQLAGNAAAPSHTLCRGFPCGLHAWMTWENSVHVTVHATRDASTHPEGCRYQATVETSMGRTLPELFCQMLWPYLALHIYRDVAVHDCQRCDSGFFRDPAAYARHARHSLDRGFGRWAPLLDLGLVDDSDDPFEIYQGLLPQMDRDPR
jgi:hypothetical protein